MQSRASYAVMGLIASVAAGCVSNTSTLAPQDKGSDRAPINMAAVSDVAIPDLPQGYKYRAAIHMVHGFVKDAAGPPEISHVIKRKALLGSYSIAVIRFPVRKEVAARRNLVALFGDGPFYRCASISSSSGLSTLGATEIAIETEKLDLRECSPTLTYTRYRELEELASRCRDPNKSCAVVSTPLGGAFIPGT